VESVLEMRGVSKRYGEHFVVTDFDLEVPRGICFGLLGPNGAGKTTTLRMVYGVTRPTAGSIRVFGIDALKDIRAIRSRLGVTLQDNVLIDGLTPRENLAIFGRYHLMTEPALSKRVEELIDFLDLRSHADVRASDLSGGYQRRLSIAMSLMNDPELLILDEPTTGLDPAVRHTMWSRVRGLRTEGKTVLITTHYMDEAERLCDQVMIMSEGRAVAAGAPAELIEAHLGRQAIELDCEPEEEARLTAGSPIPGQRLRAGSRLMIYSDDPSQIVSWVHERDGGERRKLIVRPSNLEDVFLSLTGTSLEDGA
jgi:lipooligosaccharide transport system ATP-binding protein